MNRSTQARSIRRRQFTVLQRQHPVHTPGQFDGVPAAPAPDADTPAETIKTLTANVAAMTAEVNALRRDNASLGRENQALLTSRTQIEENVTTRVKRELLAREHEADNRARIDSGVLSSLTARVDALAESLSNAAEGS